MRTQTGVSPRRGILKSLALSGAAALAALGGARLAGAQDDPELAATATRMVIDMTLPPGVGPTSLTRDPAGPQRGDFFYVGLRLFAEGDPNGTQIGTYQCFGAWTALPGGGTDDRLVVVQFALTGRGNLSGVINEGGHGQHLGAIIGGTGEFMGARGQFRQDAVTPPPTPNFGARVTFDLL